MLSSILMALLVWGGAGLLWIVAFHVLGLGFGPSDSETEGASSPL